MKQMKNVAKVIASSSFPNGEVIDTLEEVTDTDPSSLVSHGSGTVRGIEPVEGLVVGICVYTVPISAF